MTNAQDRLDLKSKRYVSATFAPEMTGFVQQLTGLAMIILSWFSVTLEVYIRHTFGERYLSWVRLWIAWSAIGWLNAVATLGAAAGWGWGSLLFMLIYFGFLGLSLYHRIAINRRNKRHILWHSQSFGISRLWGLPFFKRFDDWTLYRFIEPLVFLCLGIFIFPLHGIIGLWLIGSSVALGIKNNVYFSIERDGQLDQMDAQIEVGYAQQSQDGAPKEATAGWIATPLPLSGEQLRELRNLASRSAGDIVVEMTGPQAAGTVAAGETTTSSASPASPEMQSVLDDVLGPRTDPFLSGSDDGQEKPSHRVRGE